MADKLMDVKIMAPDRVFYEGQVSFMEFNTTEGIVGIYPKHIPMTVVVAPGVLKIVEENGEISFRTKGDFNNTEDKDLVPAENLVGIYQSRIAGAGKIAMFMQSTAGLIICVVLPIVLLVGYDIIRRRIYEKNKQTDTNALLAELEALKAEKAAKEAENAEEKAE